jgi:hypothetical protein
MLVIHPEMSLSVPGCIYAAGFVENACLVQDGTEVGFMIQCRVVDICIVLKGVVFVGETGRVQEEDVCIVCCGRFPERLGYTVRWIPFGGMGRPI